MVYPVVRVARQVAQDVWVVVAEKHVPAIEQRLKSYLHIERCGPAPRWHWPPTSVRVVPSIGPETRPNPDYISELASCRLMSERADADLTLIRPDWPASRRRMTPWAMLDMLWAPELREVLGRHGIAASAKTPRHTAMVEATELMTGREIRRAVCHALRCRNFPRADAPKENEGWLTQ